MNACNVLLPGGINGDCQIPLSELRNVIITDKDVKLSYTAKETLASWTNLIKQSLTIYAVAGIDSYNNTTDDPNIVKGAVSGIKSVMDIDPPTFELFLDSNMCDFNEVLNTVRGGVYGVWYELKDGTILGNLDKTGNDIGYFKPFTAKLRAVSKLLQEPGANTAFKMYVSHTKTKQLYNQFIFSPTWDVTELVEAMPIGLNMVKTAAIVAATATQAVNVKVRCGAAKTGLVVGDFEFSTDMSNVITPNAGAFAETGGGNYTIVIEKSTSTPIVSNDIVYMRVKVLSSSDVTYISNWVSIEGVTP